MPSRPTRYIAAHINRDAAGEDLPLTIEVKKGSGFVTQVLRRAVGEAAVDIIIAARDSPDHANDPKITNAMNAIGLFEYFESGGSLIAAHFPPEDKETAPLRSALLATAELTTKDQLEIYAASRSADSFTDETVFATSQKRKELGSIAGDMAAELVNVVVNPRTIDSTGLEELTTKQTRQLRIRVDRENPVLLFGRVDEHGRYVAE